MATDAPHDVPKLVSGRKVLLFSAVFLLVATFLATWGTLRWVESDLSHVPTLQWANRQDWHTLRVQWVELVPPPGPRPPFESKYRNILIDAAPEQLDAVATLAGVSDVAEASDLRAMLEAHPDVFYGWYLLGLAEQQAGDGDTAEQAFARATKLAPAALVIPFQNDAGGPAADLILPLIVIHCGQKRDGELDDSVRLIYRNVTTDAQGQVYLPVYSVPCLVAEVQAPAGTTVVTPWPGWFTFPGQAGQVPAAEVRER